MQMQEAEDMFTMSDAWRAAYPDAAIGVLAMCGVTNPEGHAELDARKEELRTSCAHASPDMTGPH